MIEVLYKYGGVQKIATKKHSKGLDLMNVSDINEVLEYLTELKENGVTELDLDCEYGYYDDISNIRIVGYGYYNDVSNIRIAK